MVLTFSNMLPLGSKAPGFRLNEVVSNKMLSLEEAKSDVATVIMFLCNHCPYVKHLNQEIANLSNEYLKKGFHFWLLAPTMQKVSPMMTKHILNNKPKLLVLNFHTFSMKHN